jgi:hypothetical protein
MRRPRESRPAAGAGLWGWAAGLASFGILYVTVTAIDFLTGVREEGDRDASRYGDAAGEAGAASQPDRLSAAGIAITAAALLIGIAALIWILWIAMGPLGKRPPTRGTRAQVLPQAEDSVWFADYARGRKPPFPVLQTRPAEDLRALRAREDSILEGYGWEDSIAGKARIPVDRAMEILAARGLTLRLGPDTLPIPGEARGNGTAP